MIEYRDNSFPVGLLASMLAHSVFFYMILFGIGFRNVPGERVIYSVTLEGSGPIGGISQVPKDDKQTPVAPPKNVSQEEAQETPPPPTEDNEEKKEVKPDEPEDAEVSVAEKPEEVKKEQPTPKATPTAKATPAPKKADKKPTVTPTASPKKKQPDAKDINKNYQQALQRYLGESTDAGGKGFGSAGGIGKGMGGGIQRSPEWFLYKDRLESAVKRGWNWHDPNAQLMAAVSMEISPQGVVRNVRIVRSSGNPKFDDTVVRAVNKASPVPPAPPHLYPDFAYVEFDFSPQ